MIKKYCVLNDYNMHLRVKLKSQYLLSVMSVIFTFDDKTLLPSGECRHLQSEVHNSLYTLYTCIMCIMRVCQTNICTTMVFRFLW